MFIIPTQPTEKEKAQFRAFHYRRQRIEFLIETGKISMKNLEKMTEDELDSLL